MGYNFIKFSIILILYFIIISNLSKKQIIEKILVSFGALLLVFCICNSQIMEGNNDDPPQSTYILAHDYSLDPTSFVDPTTSDEANFRYYVGDDLTGGSVSYDKWSELITNDQNTGRTRIKVSDPEPNAKVENKVRKSIRLHSNVTYDEGLFIMKLHHMPVGPGVWPAFWLGGVSPHPHEWAYNG